MQRDFLRRCSVFLVDQERGHDLHVMAAAVSWRRSARVGLPKTLFFGAIPVLGLGGRLAGRVAPEHARPRHAPPRPSLDAQPQVTLSRTVEESAGPAAP